MKEIEIGILGRESASVELFEVVNFLYDLNISYEIARLATDPKYESFRFSRFVFFRTGRPLRKDERLRLLTLEHGSPTKLVTRLTATSLAIGSIWGLVQIYTKIADHPFEHRKLVAEAKKAELEVLKMEREADSAAVSNFRPPTFETFERHLFDRGAFVYFDQVTNRLLRLPVRVEEVEVRIVDEEKE